MSLEDTLKKLHFDYIAALPEKIGQAKLYLEQQNYVELQEFFHKLKGSGKTYGVQEVTAVSAFAEKALINQHKQKHVLVDISIQLLEKIYISYQDGQMYDLTHDPKFQKLQTLIN